MIIEDSKAELLMQSKHLVHTSYEITAVQNRIFYYCLLNAQKEKNGNFVCTVAIQELKKLIPFQNNRTLANIKKTFGILQSSSIEFEEKDLNDNDKIDCKYTLIAGSRYHHKKEVFEIIFLEDLYNHIINYNIYAPLNMDVITKFKSFYSQRLYELIRLWSRTNIVIIKEFKIDQLKFILGVEGKYPHYKNFKQRVLNQAIKEINSIGDIELKIDEIKKNRRTESIRFTILDKGERKLSKINGTISEFKDNKQEDVVSKWTKSDDSIVANIQPNIKATNREIAITTNKEFYTPNKKLFTAKTLQMFQEDFSDYDFKDKHNQSKFYEATGITMAKDQENNIKVKSYNYFKIVLLDKLDKKESNEVSYKKTKFHNFDESFTQYSPEELDEIIEKSQKEKYK